MGGEATWSWIITSATCRFPAEVHVRVESALAEGQRRVAESEFLSKLLEDLIFTGPHFPVVASRMSGIISLVENLRLELWGNTVSGGKPGEELRAQPSSGIYR